MLESTESWILVCESRHVQLLALNECLSAFMKSSAHICVWTAHIWAQVNMHVVSRASIGIKRYSAAPVSEAVKLCVQREREIAYAKHHSVCR
jgi:hypothetical protein